MGEVQRAGQSLSFCVILGPVGAGGMDAVYRAQATRLEGWSLDCEPTCGEPRKLFEVGGGLTVTDFDTRSRRFLGFQPQVPAGRRISWKAGWIDAQRER